MEHSTVRYYVYRCHRCHRILTRLQVYDAWDKAAELDKQDGGTHAGICVCGSRHINPTNLSVWEEITSFQVWKLWWVEIARPWLKKHLHV